MKRGFVMSMDNLGFHSRSARSRSAIAPATRLKPAQGTTPAPMQVRIVREKYGPGLALPLALKDVRLALSEADAAIVPMPLVRIVHDGMIADVARGYESLDWSVLGRVAAGEAGLMQANESSPR